LDHKMLLHKDDPVLPLLRQQGEPVYVMSVNPTAENIARHIYGINDHFRWVGLRNYLEVLQDSLALSGFLRTLLYTAIIVPLSIGGGLGLALLLNRRVRAVGLFRTIFYLPSVVPVVASATLWRLIFDRDSGAANALLEFLHGPVITW